MKTKSKQRLKKLLLPSSGILALFVTVMFFFLSSSVSFAPTKLIAESEHSKSRSIGFAQKGLMSDDELSATNAQSFLTIDTLTGADKHGSQDAFRVNINLRAEVNLYQASSKWGYYNNGTNTDWDTNAEAYYFGQENKITPLIITGGRVEMGFDNIADPTKRKLNYLEISTPDLYGPVSATFVRMTALVVNASTGSNNGVLYRVTAAQSYRRTQTFEHIPLGFLFAAKYDYTPIDKATVVPIRGVFTKMPQSTFN